MVPLVCQHGECSRLVMQPTCCYLLCLVASASAASKSFPTDRATERAARLGAARSDLATSLTALWALEDKYNIPTVRALKPRKVHGKTLARCCHD